MDQWKQAIIQGNAAFAEHRFDAAEQHYRAACERASLLLPHWFDAEEITAATVVSHQNLAELYFRQQRLLDAIDTYRRLNRLLAGYRARNAGCSPVQAIADGARRRMSTEFLAKVQALAPEADQEFYRQAEDAWHEMTRPSPYPSI